MSEKTKSAELTPEKWKRTGWIALCKEHFDLYYDKDKDGYGDVCEEAEPLFCDHEGCKREADYELYPDLAKTIKESETVAVIETGEDSYDIALTDSFLDDLKKIEEASEG